jgi:hypothetical protein
LPAPQAPALFDPGGSGAFDPGGAFAPNSGFASSPAFAPNPGFSFGPETVDFGRYSEPVPVRSSGPPGLVVLIVMLAAMAGGAKVGEVITRPDVAAVDHRK